MQTEELITNLLGRFPSKDELNDETKEKALFALNIALSSVWRSARWNFRKRIGQVCLIPNYTTGTCSYTKFDGTNSSASRTVTFSGASLTQSMVGRYWKPSAGSTWYKIAAITGSTAYLGVECVDESTGGQEYQIWKRFYYLKSEVDEILDGFNWDKSSPINYKSNEILTQEQGNISNTGNPEIISDMGIDPYDDVVYSTGKISGNEFEDTITGSDGASFLGNVDTGDILTVNNIEYYVKRVESDNSIILYNKLRSKLSTQSYKIRKNNPVGVQYWYPSDKYRVVDYTYLAKPYELRNLLDILPLDFDYVKAILDRAEAIMLKDIDKDKWIQTLNLYNSELESLKNKKPVIRSRSNQFSPVTFRNLM